MLNDIESKHLAEQFQKASEAVYQGMVRTRGAMDDQAIISLPVYTDGVHLASPSIEILHLFAAKIGLHRQWFQDHPNHPHYDLKGLKLRRALACGAISVSRKELVKKCYRGKA